MIVKEDTCICMIILVNRTTRMVLYYTCLIFTFHPKQLAQRIFKRHLPFCNFWHSSFVSSAYVRFTSTSSKHHSQETYKQTKQRQLRTVHQIYETASEKGFKEVLYFATDTQGTKSTLIGATMKKKRLPEDSLYMRKIKL
jgi:hypothetical protein